MRVMIAVDGSVSATHAADVAVDLFGTDGVDYSLVSVGSWPVVTTPELGISSAIVIEPPPIGVEPSQISPAADVAGDVADDLPVDTEIVTVTGEPGPLICELAEEHGIDVVVVGAHDRGWWSRVVEPSASKHIVEHAPCHVLVVRSPTN